MKLPVWFPYPRAWIRLFLSIILGTLSLASIRIFSFWSMLIIPSLDQVILIILGIASYLPFAFFIFPYNHFFGDYPKKWNKRLPAPNSIKEALTLYTGFYISLLVTAFIFVPLIPYSQYKYLVFHAQNYKEFYQYHSLLFANVYCVISLYIFHIDWLLSQKSVVEKKMKTEKSPEPQNTHESSEETKIAMELEKMKTQIGKINKPK